MKTEGLGNTVLGGGELKTKGKENKGRGLMERDRERSDCSLRRSHVTPTHPTVQDLVQVIDPDVTRSSQVAEPPHYLCN